MSHPDTSPVVYLVDDDTEVLAALSRLLRAYGYAVRGFADPEAFLSSIAANELCCAVLDLAMPGMNGLAVQQSLREHCGVTLNLEVTEWNTLLTATRQGPNAPVLAGSNALNVSSPSSDPAVMVRYFATGSVPPNGFNWGQWRDAEFERHFAALEAARTPEDAQRAYAAAHARIVDGAPWLFIVHDLNPRAMSRRVRGFVSAQSWFQDLVPVELQ